MPYYHWKGVTITGQMKKGKLFAQTLDHLDQLLLKREIALISGRPATQWIKRSISIQDRAQLFAQLATLIEAGVLIPDALSIVANQIDRVELQEIMHEVARQVNEGEQLSIALEGYPEVANQIMIQLIRAGEQSGTIAYALNALSSHLIATNDFYRRMRSALMLPIITILFFLAILLLIFVGIMPRFIDVFASMGKEIPPLTKKMLFISQFLRSSMMGVSVALLALFALLSWRLTRKGRGRRILDSILIRMPFIGSLLRDRFLAYSMQAIAVLVQGGMPLLQAIEIVKDSVQNHIFRDQLSEIEADIENGASLSHAMARHSQAIFGPDIVAMIEVAEASGQLPGLLDRVSQNYYGRVTQRISLLTVLIQPAIMLLLGLLVAFLIFAVYGPIFTMSSGF